MGHKIYSSQRNASQDTIFPLASVTKIFPVGSKICFEIFDNCVYFSATNYAFARWSYVKHLEKINSWPKTKKLYFTKVVISEDLDYAIFSCALIFVSRIHLNNVFILFPYISYYSQVLMLHMLIANKTINSIDDDVSQYEPRFGYINPFSTKKITFRYTINHYLLF